jgi:nitrogen fixation/metabolism regulation signal transduction histidine kinase
LWVARSIASPLQDAMQMAQRIAGGDLGTRIPPQPSNQAGKLLQAMQAMNDSLLNLVGQVQQRRARDWRRGQRDRGRQSGFVVTPSSRRRRWKRRRPRWSS